MVKASSQYKEEERWQTLLRDAEKLGAEYGKNAASWYFTGSEPDDTYASVLKGIEDGDPQVMDTMPASPLSGEWAGEPVEADILNELGYEPPDDDLETYNEESDDVIRAFLDAYSVAVNEEVERMCRVRLGKEVT